MCTINMTFDVPETKAIDIDALKQHMQAYFNLVLTFPSVLKKEQDAEDAFTQQMLDRFAGSWHGEESAEEITAIIREGRSIRKPLSM